MIVGTPKEIKNHEYRVGLTPESAQEIVRHGHQVLIESGAGAGIGASDDAYRDHGAEIVVDAATVFDRAELIVKVKEPQAQERALLRPHHTLFTYLHLAPDPDQTRDLIQSGATCIAYETVTDERGGLPLLAPMSQVAGRLAVQAGAMALERSHGGRGVLLGGVPGVPAARVVVIGGGVVGENAIQIAIGMGADVTVLDRSADVLARLSARFGPALTTVFSTRTALEKQLRRTELLIGAVLVKGAAAPKLVTRDMLARLPEGAVLVDVAIDQGGCFETSHPTTHAEPTYVVDGIVHYCVANMPGAVPRTSTYALNNVTLPYTLALADRGPVAALRADRHLMNGLNVYRGHLTEQAVAESLSLPYHDPADLLAAA